MIALLRKGQLGEKYNFGGNSERTNLNVVELICDILDRIAPTRQSRRSLITFVPDRPGHDQRYAVDASKARAELEWRPMHTFESGLERTINWYLHNSNGGLPYVSEFIAANAWASLRWRADRMASAVPILVVGKSGQLGRCLFEAASCRNIRVIVAGRPDFDIEHRETVDRALTAFDPGVLINAAAYTAVDKAETEPEPERCYAANCDGARRFAAVAWRYNVPFIHISTDYVFDGRKPSPYHEDDLTAPHGVYGRSKLEGERAVLAVHPDALILRTSWLYSAFGSNFLTTMLRLAQSRPTLRFVNDQCGCPTSAHELAAALPDISTNF